MVLNAYAMSWFEFQNTCRLLRQEMPSATHHEKPYWTKYYKRQSDLIGKYGKYVNVQTMVSLLKKTMFAALLITVSDIVCNIFYNLNLLKTVKLYVV